jgi:hypothetical protein
LLTVHPVLIEPWTTTQTAPVVPKLPDCPLPKEFAMSGMTRAPVAQPAVPVVLDEPLAVVVTVTVVVVAEVVVVLDEELLLVVIEDALVLPVMWVLLVTPALLVAPVPLVALVSVDDAVAVSLCEDAPDPDVAVDPTLVDAPFPGALHWPATQSSPALHVSFGKQTHPALPGAQL